MSAIIKGTNVVFTGSADIDNRIKAPLRPAEPREQLRELINEAETENVSHDKLEQLKESYINEGKRIAKELTERANEEAARITERSAGEMMNARRDAEIIRKKAAEETKLEQEKARKSGYDEGLKKGADDGYIQGLKKCKETMLELKRINEELLREKSQLMQTYEHQMFDMIFAVAQKITVGALRQKDRGIIEKMLKEAAKQFRNAKTVKVTLSALDLSEDIDADVAALKDIFAPSAYVAFDVQKDAESGTLIVDNGSEIVDASISTQLRMIEELGRGKYRDAKAIITAEQPEEPAKDENESVQPENPAPTAEPAPSTEPVSSTPSGGKIDQGEIDRLLKQAQESAPAEKTFGQVLEETQEAPSLTLLEGYEQDKDEIIHVEKDGDEQEYVVADEDVFTDKAETLASGGKIDQSEIDKLLKQAQGEAEPAPAPVPAPAPAQTGGKIDQSEIDRLLKQAQGEAEPAPAPVQTGGKIDQSEIDKLLKQAQGEVDPAPAPAQTGGKIDQNEIDRLLKQAQGEAETEKAPKKTEAAEKPAAKRSRKPTNPLLTKMIDNLGEKSR